MIIPDLGFNLLDHIKIGKTLIKILENRTDQVKKIVFVRHNDSRITYKMAFELERLGLIKKKKGGSAIDLVFDATPEYFEFRKQIQSINNTVKKLSSIPR